MAGLPTFPLFDPPRRLRRARPASLGVPRITVPGFGHPFAIPPAPAPNDLLDARRLVLRLAALSHVLDDLPRQARRYALWRSRRDAERARFRNSEKAGRGQRVWPLRAGRPPGRPPANSRRPRHAVHDILEATHGLAFWALESPDTS